MDGVRKTLFEVLQAILPVTLAVLALQFALVRMPAHLLVHFLLGAMMVVAGMTLFLWGVRAGVLPLGEAIGAELPRRNSLLLVIGVAFLIGLVATVAEPDVLVLSKQAEVVSGRSIPGDFLVYTIGISTGMFAAVALLRVVYGVRLAYLLAASYAIVLVLTFFTPAEFVPVAFDSGGVTMGPVTVPLALALGIGFTSVMAGKSSVADGLGIIALGSVSPIIAVMIMGIILA